ncbi:S8 family peptidase [Sphaerotilus mobilis]|uniref:Serine protease n=1 Tax=Sphaerotilus mobilis TaxID=47994 RepID=A0A4Q7L9M5_9BURK|nr:S8 family peptidase [Sphaerotilus mobilis]RZS46805.1 serine protease [Sphaerotilus mobilis]
MPATSVTPVPCLSAPSKVLPLVIGMALLAVLSLPALAYQSDDAPRASQRPASVGAADDEDETDRLIVKYRSAENRQDLSVRSRDGLRVAGNRAGLQLERVRGHADGGHVVKANRRLKIAELRRLAQDLRNGDNDIEYVEPDRLMQAQVMPNDPQIGTQWHYTEAAAGIRAPQAWDKSTGSGVRVAVIDTGVRRHADLAANLLPGYDFITDTKIANDGTARDTDPVDPGDWRGAGECGTGSVAANSSWHGTHVAGTIAAVSNNGVGVAGVAYGAKVVPVRVLGKCGGYTSDIADAITWASGGSVTGVPANPYPAKVLNLSLGGVGACDVTTQTAINGARSRGAVVVVAAGNATADAARYTPASCTGVIVVSAVGRTGAIASYSNFGANVDVAAPGGDGSYTVLSTLNSGTSKPGSDSYAGYRGTSMATPHVAGIVALMLARNAALTPDQVEARLKTSAAARGFPVSCAQCGVGIVDASAAIDAALGVTPTPTPTPTPVPTTTTVAEVEPNDTLAAPQVITGTVVTVNANVASLSDLDHFKFTIGAGKTLVLTLQPGPNSDLDLQVFNSAGTMVSQSNNGTGTADSVSLLNSGTAAITVTAKTVYYSGNVGATGGAYTLKASQ